MLFVFFDICNEVDCPKKVSFFWSYCKMIDEKSVFLEKAPDFTRKKLVVQVCFSEGGIV
jgi:hypothetical protein